MLELLPDNYTYTCQLLQINFTGVMMSGAVALTLWQLHLDVLQLHLHLSIVSENALTLTCLHVLVRCVIAQACCTLNYARFPKLR